MCKIIFPKRQGCQLCGALKIGKRSPLLCIFDISSRWKFDFQAFVGKHSPRQNNCQTYPSLESGGLGRVKRCCVRKHINGAGRIIVPLTLRETAELSTSNTWVMLSNFYRCTIKHIIKTQHILAQELAFSPRDINVAAASLCHGLAIGSAALLVHSCLLATYCCSPCVPERYEYGGLRCERWISRIGGAGSAKAQGQGEVQGQIQG